MSNDRSENDAPELPPQFVKLMAQLKEDRKKLLRENAYANPEQLRSFMGQFIFTRMTEMVELMGFALYDVYSLAVSNANQQQRMRSVMNKELRKLGADVSDEELPGPSTDGLDDLQQAFYSLGTLLSKKLPEDKEVQEAYNRCAQALSDLTGDLMGYDDDDEDDEDEDDEDEKSESKKPRAKVKKKAADAEADAEVEKVEPKADAEEAP